MNYRTSTQVGRLSLNIDFIHYVVEKFSFRIKKIRTDNGYDFQTKFHCYVTDPGTLHAFIDPGPPKSNEKVERSYLKDKRGFHQELDSVDNVNLCKKSQRGEDGYNFLRLHSAHMEKLHAKNRSTRCQDVRLSQIKDS